MAIDSGRMAGQGLDVSLTFTGSADELMRGLLGGTYDVVQASPDNFVAWRERTTAPIVAWYGGSSGPISLVLAPGVEEIETLRGGRVAVDHPGTGWAPLMLRILADHGIGADEVEQEPLGATANVFMALIEGRSPAGMLNEPWATRAVGSGCQIVADHHSVAPRLQTSAGASLQPWLTAHTSAAEGFLRALMGATTWILDPASQSEALDGLVDHLRSSEEEARAVFQRATDSIRGWPPTAYPDLEGIRAVLDLRASALKRPREPPEAYMTLDVYRRSWSRS